MAELLRVIFPAVPNPSAMPARTSISVVEGEDLLDVRRETLETLLTLLEQHPSHTIRVVPGTHYVEGRRAHACGCRRWPNA